MKYILVIILILNLTLLAYLTDADKPIKIPGHYDAHESSLVSSWDLYQDKEMTTAGLPQARHYHANRDRNVSRISPPQQQSTIITLKPSH